MLRERHLFLVPFGSAEGLGPGGRSSAITRAAVFPVTTRRCGRRGSAGRLRRRRRRVPCALGAARRLRPSARASARMRSASTSASACPIWNSFLAARARAPASDACRPEEQDGGRATRSAISIGFPNIVLLLSGGPPQPTRRARPARCAAEPGASASRVRDSARAGAFPSGASDIFARSTYSRSPSRVSREAAARRSPARPRPRRVPAPCVARHRNARTRSGSSRSPLSSARMIGMRHLALGQVVADRLAQRRLRWRSCRADRRASGTRCRSRVRSRAAP